MEYFRKVGEYLYRYSSNGVYYARFKAVGKEIRRSLETIDRDLARRKLAEEKEKKHEVDGSLGKLTLRELCDRWLKTIQNSKPKTVEQKSFIADRIKKQSIAYGRIIYLPVTNVKTAACSW